MDSLSKHRVLKDCDKKSIKLTTLDGRELEYVAEPVVTVVDVFYAAPQAHKIVNVALHREYSPGIVSLSCLRLTQGVTLMSTTRLYRGHVNWG
jgi:hypothetical protein